MSRENGDDIVSPLAKAKENNVASYVKDKWFEMTLNALRATNDEGENEMMKLVRYNVSASTSGTDEKDIGSLTATQSSEQDGGD